MCTAVSTYKDTDKITKDFNIINVKVNLEKVFYKHAFTFPKSYVITQEDHQCLDAFDWGLIPSFTKSKEDSDKIRLNTINAKSETIFEKPSFKQEILQHRCIIPVDGFFEYKEINKKKYPYYIFLKDGSPMYFGGIYSKWYFNGITHSTFSIITTEANALSSEIHNTKKRMPLIFSTENGKIWLQNELQENSIKDLMQLFDTSLMDAYSVKKLTPDSMTSPESIKKYDYSELSWSLFD